MWPTTLSNLQPLLLTCCNGLGVIHLAEHKPTKRLVCVKQYQIDKASEEETRQIKDEILTMKQFSHPNILPVLTSFVCNTNVYFVSPFLSYSSCKDTINNSFMSGFPEVIAVLITKDLLSALDYIHKKKFIHRGIRASHILLDQNRAVLTGFRDCVSFVTNGKRLKCFHALPHSTKTLNWLAPELLEQNLRGYTEKSDIYSVGVTLCELCNGIEPFSDMMTTFMLTEKIRGNQPQLLDGSTCPDEEHIIIDQTADPEELEMALKTRQIYSKKQFSDYLHKFSETCMQKDPDTRPSASQLLHHSVFKQIKHTSLQEQFLIACGHEVVVDYTKIYDELGTDDLTSNFQDLQMHDDDFEWSF